MRGVFRDLTGRQFGDWTVLKRVSEPGEARVRWLCRCVCGAEVPVIAANLAFGHSSRCEECRKRLPRGSRRIDLTGKVFGQWTVLEFSHVDGLRHAWWLCRCTCGRRRSIKGSELRGRQTTRCRGCANRSRRVITMTDKGQETSNGCT